MTRSMSTTTTQTRLTDSRALWGWRALWALVVLSFTLNYAINLVKLLEIKQAVCVENCVRIHVAADEAASFAALGIPYVMHAYMPMVFELLTVLVYVVVGLLIFAQRSDDWHVLLTSAALISLGFTITGTSVTLALLGLADYRFVLAFQGLMQTLAVWVFTTFPNGRFAPRWTVVIPVACAAAMGSLVWLYQWSVAADPRGNIPNGISLLFSLMSIAVMIYRYRNTATPTERQQTKWVLLSALVVMAAFAFSLIDNVIFPGRLSLIAARVIDIASGSLLQIAFPIGILFSVLRTRLWDVDVTLNRTLVYGVVAVVLAAVLAAQYALFNVVYRALFQAENAVLPLVIGAGIIGVAYTPLRKRTQRWVDRHFFGLEYDLNQIAAAQKKAKPSAETRSGPQTGQIIGGYQIGALLGRGGMGEVYRATRDGRAVALKVLLAQHAYDAETVKRFEHEARAMQMLKHPQIVALVGAAAGNDSAQALRYLALEFVEGQDLAALIKQHGRLSVQDACVVLGDVAAALDYAHAQGIVHRDIKPSNIMVYDEYRAKVMDFGIAKLQHALTKVTGSGMIGTIDYMAPEQIMAAKEVTMAADVYALGIVAYEMLTGQTPFPRGNAAATVFAHIQQPPPDARELVPDLPRGAAHALQRAMAKAPADRYDSAADFVAALAG
jgi:predicted Ser/Thr protein kinase